MNMGIILVVGLVIILIFLLNRSFCDEITEYSDEDSIEQLISDLYAMRVITGLSRHEKEIIDKAIDYIEKAESIKNEGN